MSDEIRGSKPDHVIIDELVGEWDLAQKVLAAERRYSSNTNRLPPVVMGSNPWATKPYVSPANQDVRSDETDPGDQTHTHDAIVATLPVDVARKLCEEHPILRSLIKFHDVDDNDGDTDKLCQGAAIDLAVSIMDAGHLAKREAHRFTVDQTERIRQLKAEAMRSGVPITVAMQRGVHVAATAQPLNSNPAKSGARARRKAKRKAKGKRR